MSLRVEKLSKSFDGKKAVNQMSFEMTKPGVFGLIGTNGAGKTTTIRMILGIIRMDEGRASWDGRPITRETMNFGYMPEERGIYMKSKILEQLVYFGMLRGMNKIDARQSASSLMERVGIAEYKEVEAEKLSKGNQQKVQLIATLVHKPELIFLDEPFSGLDPLNTEVLSRLLTELVEEKKFIVMSSHQMSTVEEFCEDLVMLHHGETILQGNLKNIKAGYGHTNLLVNAVQDFSAIAADAGLIPIANHADEVEYRITGDDMARDFLGKLVGNGIFPVKYEIREPSLHEIFIEKAGVEI